MCKVMYKAIPALLFCEIVSALSCEVIYYFFEIVAITKGKIYEVISIEKDWYRIMTEIDEDYLFPPEVFEIIEE